MSESPFLDNRERIFENSVGFVIFDKFPVSKGHCLIIPNRIYSDYFDSTEEEIIGLNNLLFKSKCNKFYKDKTYERVALAINQNPNIFLGILNHTLMVKVI